MAEYIEREALLGSIGLIQLHFVAHGDNKSLYDIINEQPAADVAPVVRCKDCKHNPGYKTKEKGMVWCRQWRANAPINGFCSYGERRTE